MIKSLGDMQRLAAELALCKRALAPVPADDQEIYPEDIDMAVVEMQALLVTKVDPADVPKLEAELFEKLNFDHQKDRWLMCVHLLGPVRQDIMHAMFKGFVAYSAMVAGPMPGDDMTSILKGIGRKFMVRDKPDEFFEDILVAVRQPMEGQGGMLSAAAEAEYVAAVAELTCIKVDEILKEIAPLLSIGSMINEVKGPPSIEQLEAAGTPPELIARLREEMKNAEELPLDVLEAKSRIHAAVLDYCGDDVGMLQQYMAWSMNPEKLIIKGDTCEYVLLDEVAKTGYTVEQIVVLLRDAQIIFAAEEQEVKDVRLADRDDDEDDA